MEGQTNQTSADAGTGATPEQPVATTPAQAQVTQPPAPQQPEQKPPAQNQTPNATGEDPGKTFGIISLVTSLLGISLLGLIFGIIGRKKSKAAGYSNGLALAGIIISIIGMIIGIIIISLVVFGTVNIVQKCQELGPGTHYVDGATYTCS